MKKFLILFISVFMLCSCSKEDKVDYISPLKTFKMKNIQIDSNEQNFNITLPKNVIYKVTSSEVWCRCYVENNVINVIAIDNNFYDGRYSKIYVEDLFDNTSITFNIIQMPRIKFNVTPKNITLTGNDTEFKVDIESNTNMWNVETNCDWITINGSGANVVYFTVDENKTNEDRSTTIDFVYTNLNNEKIKLQSISVTQNKTYIEPVKPDNPVITEEDWKNVNFTLSNSLISIGNKVTLSCASKVINNTKKDIKIVSFKFYVDNTLKKESNDLPITLNSNKECECSFKYEGTYNSSMHVEWAVESDGHTITKKLNIR